MTDLPGARRSLANLRLRWGVLMHARGVITESAAVVAEGVAREAAAAGLHRLASTASAVGLTQVGGAARSAGDLLVEHGLAALVGLAQAVRAAGVADLLPPVVYVGDAPPLGVDDGLVEPIVVRAKASDAVIWARVFGASTLVVPNGALSPQLVAAVAGAPGLDLLAYGGSRNGDARRLAAERGVVGFVSAPVHRDDLLHWARGRRVSRGRGAAVVLAGLPGPQQDALGEALGALGLRPLVRPVAEVNAALHELMPAAVLFGDIDGLANWIDAARGHVGRSGVALLALGGDPSALFEAGVDDVLPRDAAPEQVARRVAARVARIGGLAPDRDGLTGLFTYRAWLDGLQRVGARARRTDEAFAVALIGVDHFDLVERKHGLSVVGGAMRVLGAALQRGVRRHDLIGRLTPDIVGVCLVGCTETAARRRLGELVDVFRQRASADRRLESLALSVGFSDNAIGVDGVLQRAENDLYDCRAHPE